MSQIVEEKSGDVIHPIAMIDISRVLTWSDHSIKMYGTPDEPWFCGNDVASLFYTDYKKALQDNVRAKHKTTLKNLHEKGGGKFSPTSITYNEGKLVLINEPGLILLVAKSNKPIAFPFQDWIAEEVIPSIRKTGAYQINIQLQSLTSELTNQRLLTDQSTRIAEEQKKLAEEAQAKADAEQKRADDIQSDAEKAKVEHIAETQQLKDQIAPLQAAIATIGESKEKWTKASAIPIPQMENYMYIASCTSLMLKSHYKIGGVGDATKFAGRLANYNGSHTAEDPFVFVWVMKCYDYLTIENAFWTIAEGFRDKQDTSKEMIRLRFEHIISILTSAIEANKQNTELFATQFPEFQRSTIEDAPVVQSKIDPPTSEKKLRVEKVKPGKIDVGTMTTAAMHAIVITCIEEIARRTIPGYTFATDRITKPIVIQWSDVSPHFESYDKGALWWRGQTQTAISGSSITLVIRKPKVMEVSLQASIPIVAGEEVVTST